MRVIIAGGGTGGHLFPGIAIAEAFRRREPDVEILFVGTSNPIEVSTLAKKGFDHMGITAEGFRRRGPWQQIRSLLKVPVGLWQAVRIIRRFDPDVIIGVGGYASGAVAVAARPMRKKIVIHEQNVMPGLTNRILGRFANRIFISFPDDFNAFASSKTVIAGNPVRRELLCVRSEGRPSDRFEVLVLGGSQGSHALNRAVVEALDNLRNPAAVRFVHQSGTKDESWVAQAYEDLGIDADVKPFFEEMAGRYGSAHLVICRAGASTVSELMALGKPAIFVPFPFAVNNHQELNARYVADVGGGEVILEKDLSGALLADRLNYYAEHPEALADMAKQTLAHARPNAAEVIVDQCREMVSGGRIG